MPIANEEHSIQPLIRDILTSTPPSVTLCPVMDSFSKDRTRAKVEELQPEYGDRLRLLIHEKSTGAVSCYMYGFRYAIEAGATAIIEMDGGGSHSPRYIKSFLDK